MLAAERGAAPLTLAAYQNDLSNLAGFLAPRGVALEAAARERLHAATLDFWRFRARAARSGLCRWASPGAPRCANTSNAARISCPTPGRPAGCSRRVAAPAT